MLFGWPLSGICFGHLERLRVDDVERALGFVADVDAAAVGRDRRRRGSTSIPVITPTTLLVAGSMTWTLSPALLVWMIRTFLSDARRHGRADERRRPPPR